MTLNPTTNPTRTTPQAFLSLGFNRMDWMTFNQYVTQKLNNSNPSTRTRLPQTHYKPRVVQLANKAIIQLGQTGHHIGAFNTKEEAHLAMLKLVIITP